MRFGPIWLRPLGIDISRIIVYSACRSNAKFVCRGGIVHNSPLVDTSILANNFGWIRLGIVSSYQILLLMLIVEPKNVSII